MPYSDKKSEPFPSSLPQGLFNGASYYITEVIIDIMSSSQTTNPILIWNKVHESESYKPKVLN